MATLQVRSIDDQLYEALGRRAAMENRSISQEVVAILKDYLSRPVFSHESATAAFLELAGSWQDEREVHQIASDLRKSRRSRRRFKDIY